MPIKGVFNILIIKFGAAGDVLRTTPILKALKKTYPSSRLSWVAEKDSLALLENNPYIDNLVAAGPDNLKVVLGEKYDLVLSFDKEKLAIALATCVKSRNKLGFKMNSSGALDVFDENSFYALRLGIDNTLKFANNSKTYQTIMYEMAGLTVPYGPYIFNLDESRRLTARSTLYRFGIKPCHTVVALNTGVGKVFLTKKWPEEYFVKLSRMLNRIKGVKVILLGGRRESRLNKRIVGKKQSKAINIGTYYSKKDFAGIIQNCDIIVTSDTLSMHLAIALKRPVVALFGSTAAREIDLYGLGKKMQSKAPCSPCYKSLCKDMRCMKSISPDEVFKEIEKLIGNSSQLKIAN